MNTPIRNRPRYGSLVLLSLIILLICYPSPTRAANRPRISALDHTTYVIKEDGGLWAAGMMTFTKSEQWPYGDNTQNRREHTAVPIPVTRDKDWEYVATDFSYGPFLAIKSDGSLWGWEWMPSGLGPTQYPKEKWSLGFSTAVRFTPTQVSTDPGWRTWPTGKNPPEKEPLKKVTDRDLGWIAAATGWKFAIMLQADGTLWRWGTFNEYLYQNGSGIHYPHPTMVGNDHDWRMISTRGGHAVALKTDGSLWEWCAGGTPINIDDPSLRWVPDPVQLGSEKDWTVIASGRGFTLALKTDGSLWGWGTSVGGVLGVSPEESRPIPSFQTPQRIGTDTDWAAINAGASHALAIKKDGSLWTWGSNNKGQLGLGEVDLLPHPLPTQVGDDRDWVQADGGRGHSVALKKDGSIWTWGDNFLGQLGNGTEDSRAYPGRGFSDNAAGN